MRKSIIQIAMVICVAATAGLLRAEEWARPNFGSFTNTVALTNVVGRYQTLKYIHVQPTSTNGAGNTFTAWLEHVGSSTVSVSNSVMTADVALNTTTNARSGELNEMYRHGDVLYLGNTNATVTNRYFLILSDKQP